MVVLKEQELELVSSEETGHWQRVYMDVFWKNMRQVLDLDYFRISSSVSSIDGVTSETYSVLYFDSYCELSAVDCFCLMHYDRERYPKQPTYEYFVNPAAISQLAALAAMTEVANS